MTSDAPPSSKTKQTRSFARSFRGFETRSPVRQDEKIDLWLLTSGKFPFEKTTEWRGKVRDWVRDLGTVFSVQGGAGGLTEEASLPTGSVPYDDKLASDLWC